LICFKRKIVIQTYSSTVNLEKVEKDTVLLSAFLFSRSYIAFWFGFLTLHHTFPMFFFLFLTNILRSSSFFSLFIIIPHSMTSHALEIEDKNNLNIFFLSFLRVSFKDKIVCFEILFIGLNIFLIPNFN